MGAPQYHCAPALSVNSVDYDITDGSYKYDPELHEIFTNASFFGSYTMGNCKASFTVKTHDAALALLYFKGMEATDVQLTFKRSPLTPNADLENYTFATGSVAWKISNCRVTDVVEFGGGSDKKPTEFSITFMSARKSSDGSDPTITKTVVAGS